MRATYLWIIATAIAIWKGTKAFLFALLYDFTDEGVKAGDPFGETLGNLAPMLAKEMGAIYIDDSGSLPA